MATDIHPAHAHTHDHAHGLDPDLPLLTTTVEKLVQWARKSAIWPAQAGLLTEPRPVIAAGVPSFSKAFWTLRRLPLP